jgi:hypothetical protein
MWRDKALEQAFLARYAYPFFEAGQPLAINYGAAISSKF